jgi:hypothetical protein
MGLDMGRGLYAKYEVKKNGKPIYDCFVLRPDRDAAARAALRAYAKVTPNTLLAVDIHEWLSAIENDDIGPT